MTFSESTQHVVEVAIINSELVFEMLLELVNHHILGSPFHFFEDLTHIVMMLGLLAIVGVIVGVVEEDESEFFTQIVVLDVLQFLLVATGNTLCIHVRARSPFKAISMSLQGELVLSILFCD
jgi:hypothetical protein